MPVTKSTKLHKALEFLKSRQQGVAGVSVTQRAHEAGVSYVTMWKASRILLESQPAEPQPNESPNDRSYAWERLASLIQVDLLAGHISADPHLPHMKVLCARYSSNFRTMRKALDFLCERKVLNNSGRRFILSRSTTRRSSLKIAVLVLAWYEGPLRFVAEYDQEFMIHLDHEAAQRSVNVEILRFEDVHGRLAVSDVIGAHEQSLHARSDIDGFILPASFGGCLNPQLLTQLHSIGKPLVIIDEFGGWDLPSYLARSNKVLVIRAGPDKSAACTAARELIALGHKCFAFFSIFHKQHWPQICLDGLTETIARAGTGYSLTPFLIEGTQTTDEYIRAAWTRCPDVSARAWYNAWKETAPPAFVQQLAPHWQWDLEQQMAYAEMRYRVYELCDRAIADKSITCWIAPDTDAAWSMHDYLIQRAPQLSMVTFGWSPEVTKSRISSWDLNAAAAVRAAVEFLLYPARALPGQRGRELRIDGMLAMRESLQRKRDTPVL